MKQLDKRVSKLEVLSGRRPRLAGRSAEECLELVMEAYKISHARADIYFDAMSDEQLEESHRILGAELERCAGREDL
jgi:hypothetical protein